MPKRFLRAVALGCATALSVTACGGQDSSTAPARNSAQVNSVNSGEASGGTFAYSFTPGVMRKSVTKLDADLLTRMDAIIGIPDADEPRPVVYVLHGSHAPCSDEMTKDVLSSTAVTIPWPEGCRPADLRAGQGTSDPEKDGEWIAYEAGLAYLANSLRKAGFVTVSIDMAGVEGNMIGEAGSPDRQRQLVIAEHQKLLADFAKGDTHGIKMPANTARVLGSKKYAIVGHSVSGGFAAWSAGRSTDPNLFASVALQPALPVELPKSNQPENLRPLLAFFGTCDEDVQWDIAREDYPRVLRQHPDLPVAVLRVDGATHFGAQASGSQAAVMGLAKDSFPGCEKPGAVMSPEVMQAGFAAQTTAFLTQALEGRTDFTLPRDDRFAPRVLDEQKMAVRFEDETLPAADMSSPKFQMIKEQLLSPWDPEKQPSASGSL